MKKLVAIFVSVMIIIFLLISYMVHMDNKGTSNLEKIVIKKIGIKEFNYINKYDNYYIVLTDNYLYLYDNKFLELLKIDTALIHKNDKKYDIIYSNKQLMYFHDYVKNNKNTYEYYDLYTYEPIDKVVLE